MGRWQVKLTALEHELFQKPLWWMAPTKEIMGEESYTGTALPIRVTGTVLREFLKLIAGKHVDPRLKPPASSRLHSQLSVSRPVRIPTYAGLTRAYRRDVNRRETKTAAASMISSSRLP